MIHFLAHIDDVAALDRRIRGAVQSAFDAHESPRASSIVKRVRATLLDTGSTPPPRKRRRRTKPPESLRRELLAIVNQAARIADKPEHAARIVESMRRRVEGTLGKYEVIESRPN